jgi:hypothetical protein
MAAIAEESRHKYIGFNATNDDKIHLLDKWLETDEAKSMLGFPPIIYVANGVLCGKCPINFVEVFG